MSSYSTWLLMWHVCYSCLKIHIGNAVADASCRHSNRTSDGTVRTVPEEDRRRPVYCSRCRARIDGLHGWRRERGVKTHLHTCARATIRTQRRDGVSRSSCRADLSGSNGARNRARPPRLRRRVPPAARADDSDETAINRPCRSTTGSGHGRWGRGANVSVRQSCPRRVQAHGVPPWHECAQRHFCRSSPIPCSGRSRLFGAKSIGSGGWNRLDQDRGFGS